MLTVTRYHDISCGHRVVGHEGACQGLHGHNYRIHFTCTAPEVDAVGRVIDFSVIKARLCMWLEDNWDHRMLLWRDDHIASWLQGDFLPNGYFPKALAEKVFGSVRLVPMNPTAENLAHYLLHEVGPTQLAGTGVTLTAVQVDETRKCSATAAL